MVARETQTEYRMPCWRQLIYCLAGNEKFKKRRQRQVSGIKGRMNSVSKIDRVARILFPTTFCILNLCYWVGYVTYEDNFSWRDSW